MNYMDRQLRDLLDAAAGEPPHQVTVEAVRRRVARHRATRYLAAAVAVAVAVAGFTGARLGFAGARFASHPPSTLPAVHAPLQGTSGSYLGVFEAGSPPSYGPIEEFAQAAGKEPNLIGYYSGWAQPFPLPFAETMHRHGLIPLVQIDPTLASVSAIASGFYDDYLRQYADSVHDYGHPVVIGFGHEMNATWYPWGYTHTPARTFVAAWRHIVTLFRALGADNVTWLWTIQSDQPGTGPVSSWWPGANYVTWVGIDGFYSKPTDTFPRLFGPTIAQVRTLTAKPILLSETGVARDASQYANIINLFNGTVQYGLLGLVWLDNGQWRIEDSPLAERAFRLGVSRLRPVHP